MIKQRLGCVLALLGIFASPATAQDENDASADSLLNHWVIHGNTARWLPYKLFEGCPDLTDWQERGIQRLLNAQLTAERTRDLAVTWSIPLDQCDDRRLERWYFERIDELIRRDAAPAEMMSFWSALEGADSPAIRTYLWNLIFDSTRPEYYRGTASTSLFLRFAPEERLHEYLRAFQTRRMPFGMQVGQTTTLLRQDGERLLREVGQIVRINPELADQGAFAQIAASSDRYVSREARQQLGRALQAGLAAKPLTGNQRERLERAAQWLVDSPERPGPDDPKLRARRPSP